MPFNSGVKRLVVRDKSGKHLPCVMCGKTYPLPDAVHIIDEKEWKSKLDQDSKINGIPLCPNCHRVFHEVLRPYLHRALGVCRTFRQNQLDLTLLYFGDIW